MNRRLLAALIAGAVFAVLAAPRAQAQNASRFGDYEVHYNALATRALGAEMAARYAITRSDRGGLINIAVQRVAADGSSVAVPAAIRAEAVNLTGRKTPVQIREIAGDEVSYIGLFEVEGPDTYTFTLSITPQGETTTHEVRFSQNFVGG